jgi:hypothetical protein
MILLDTDTLTLLLQDQPLVQNPMQSADTDVATTIIMLIASIALAEKATLITRNARDFALVPG